MPHTSGRYRAEQARKESKRNQRERDEEAARELRRLQIKLLKQQTGEQ